MRGASRGRGGTGPLNGTGDLGRCEDWSEEQRRNEKGLTQKMQHTKPQGPNLLYAMGLWDAGLLPIVSAGHTLSGPRFLYCWHLVIIAERRRVRRSSGN